MPETVLLKTEIDRPGPRTDEHTLGDYRLNYMMVGGFVYFQGLAPYAESYLNVLDLNDRQSGGYFSLALLPFGAWHALEGRRRRPLPLAIRRLRENGDLNLEVALITGTAPAGLPAIASEPGY